MNPNKINILRWEYGSLMLFKYFKLILNLSFESKVDGVRYNHSVFNGRLIIQQNNWWMRIGWDWLLIGMNTFTVSFDSFLEISNCVFTCFFFLSAGTCPQSCRVPHGDNLYAAEVRGRPSQRETVATPQSLRRQRRSVD